LKPCGDLGRDVGIAVRSPLIHNYADVQFGCIASNWSLLSVNKSMHRTGEQWRYRNLMENRLAIRLLLPRA
jgi:hypothetical protein